MVTPIVFISIKKHKIDIGYMSGNPIKNSTTVKKEPNTITSIERFVA
jgi:hypothetical protein